jgi:lipopolysaccharide assembly outer membrane protein LptD (OstA)
MGPIARALCAALIAFALAAGVAGAQSPSPKPPSQQGLENFAGFDSIKTDTIDWNANTGDFSMPKHFTASRSGSDVSADRATGNSKRKIVHATGNVVVHQIPTGESARNSKLGSEPSTLTCDKLDADGTRKLYTASGHLHFVQGERDATADTGTLDDQSGMLHMQGNVHVKDGEQYLDANDVVYNTHSGDLKATGNVLVRSPAQTPAPNGPVSPAATAAPPKKH